MFNRTVQGAFLTVALLMGTALPTAAQSLGAGISFLGDDGGTGVVVDYSKPFRSSSDGSLGWVIDFGYNRNGADNDFAGGGGSFSTLTLQGGVRFTGEAANKLTWHGQGLVGVRRSHLDSGEEICDGLGNNCSDGSSDTGAVLTVGGAVQYALSPMVALRGQLDFPIALSDPVDGTTRFAIMVVFTQGR